MRSTKTCVCCQFERAFLGPFLIVSLCWKHIAQVYPVTMVIPMIGGNFDFSNRLRASINHLLKQNQNHLHCLTIISQRQLQQRQHHKQYLKRRRHWRRWPFLTTCVIFAPTPTPTRPPSIVGSWAHTGQWSSYIMTCYCVCATTNIFGSPLIRFECVCVCLFPCMWVLLSMAWIEELLEEKRLFPRADLCVSLCAAGQRPIGIA